GGLFNDSGGTVAITRTTFNLNTAFHYGGGLFKPGFVNIPNSSFFTNGAPRVRRIGNGATWTKGPGVPGQARANSTIANNSGGFSATGGIINTGTLLLQSSTVANNHGGLEDGPGGIANGGTLLLQNTIIARNDSPGLPLRPPSDCSGPITSLGNN